MINKFHQILLVILIVLPEISQACAVCYGAQDSPMTDGMNKAIGFLLFVIEEDALGAGGLASLESWLS